MKKKKWTNVLILSMTLILVLSLVFVGWSSDIFNKDRVVILTGNNVVPSVPFTPNPSSSSGSSNPSSSSSSSDSDNLDSLTLSCVGTNNFSCITPKNIPKWISKNGWCKTMSPWRNYCKVVNNQCVKLDCSKVSLSACKAYGCKVTSTTTPSTTTTTPSTTTTTPSNSNFVRLTVPVYGSSNSVTVQVPKDKAKLKWVWCGTTKVNSEGFLCGGDTCGTVDYRTGKMPGCQKGTILR